MRKHTKVISTALMVAGMFVATEGLTIAQQNPTTNPSTNPSTTQSTNQTTTQDQNRTTNQPTTQDPSKTTDPTTNQDANRTTPQDTNQTNQTTTTQTQDSNPSTSQDMNTPAGAKVGEKMAVSSSDMKFMQMAAMGGMTEVEAGRLASQKGSSDAVKQFGERLVQDHTKANEELMALAASKGITLSKGMDAKHQAMDAKHQAMMAKMSSLSGAEFDRAFIKQMQKDHKKDISMFQKQADKGTDAELKAFAAKTLPTLREHAQMVEQMQMSMSGKSSSNADKSTSTDKPTNTDKPANTSTPSNSSTTNPNP